MAKANRTIVGSPLTPTLLADLGAVAGQWASSDPFDPQAGWTHRYRIWTCHGYRETGNNDVGFLRVRRETSSEEGTFRLHVEQVVVETDALLSRIEADIVCRNDELASPAKWRLSSRFFGPDEKEQRAMTTHSIRPRSGIAVLGFGVLLVGVVGCSVNPATGERQISLISEQQEIALGQQEAERAMAAYGKYPDEEIQTS